MAFGFQRRFYYIFLCNNFRSKIHTGENDFDFNTLGYYVSIKIQEKIDNTYYFRSKIHT